MSAEAVMEPVEVTENASTDAAEAQRIVKDGYYLEEKVLEGDAAGFSLYVIQYTDLDAAVARMGKDAIMALLNSKLNFDLRTKAKNKLPNPEGATKEQKLAEYQKLRDAGTTVLLTPEDAENHRPGERELVSPESMLREAKKLVKEANQADAARKVELLKEAKDLKRKAAAIIAAQIDEDEAA